MSNEKWYDYVISPRFEEDMQRIQDYIAYHLMNPPAAADLGYEVEKAIEGQRFFAEAYKRYYSQNQPGIPFYCIQVKNFTIFYTVKGKTMEIRRIFHSSQDIQSYI